MAILPDTTAMSHDPSHQSGEALRLSCSAPILVGRRKGYFWFPTLMRLADGALLVSAYEDLDGYSGNPMGLYSWSEDLGQTWTQPPPVRAPFSECGVALDSGDHLLLPYRLYPHPAGMAAPAGLVPFGRREVRSAARQVCVSGWPRPPQSEGEAAQGESVTGGFVFNGQVIRLTNGAFLATLYGRFAGDTRYSLVAATSEDALDWSVRSIIADANGALVGEEGPCEAALARLEDGRLLCLLRRDGTFDNVYDPTSRLIARSYAQTYSEDEGVTWTPPVPLLSSASEENALPGPTLPGSVQPSLALLSDGTVVLSGGRPGLYVWWNQAGAGSAWQSLDLQAHHNRYCPQEPILSAVNTSSYTEVLVLNDTANVRLIVVYDRLPWGWRPIPREAVHNAVLADANSIWVVHVEGKPL